MTAVDKAVKDLAQRYDSAIECMVFPAMWLISARWRRSGRRLRRGWGKLDIWINNAGIAHPQAKLWELPAETLQAVVETNVLGVMNGAKVALSGFLAQGSGALYNLEGLGSGGRRVAGLTLYASTKAALRYLDDALFAETKGTPLVVGAILPGMVLTDMLTRQYEGRPQDWQRVKPIFNILADRVDTISPWIASQVLNNTRSGVRIAWSSPLKLLWRFISAPVTKRHVID